MSKYSTINISIRKVSLYDLDLVDLCKKIIEEDTNRYIWDISQEPTLLSNDAKLMDYLFKDFQESHIYLACYKNIAVGVFGALKIAKMDTFANFLIWIDEEMRSSIIPIRWWLLFLKEIRIEGITELYTRISKSNKKALTASRRCGFTECSLDILGKIDYNRERSICGVRDSRFNEFERLYIKRLTNRGLKNIF